MRPDSPPPFRLQRGQAALRPPVSCGEVKLKRKPVAQKSPQNQVSPRI